MQPLKQDGPISVRGMPPRRDGVSEERHLRRRHTSHSAEKKHLKERHRSPNRRKVSGGSRGRQPDVSNNVKKATVQHSDRRALKPSYSGSCGREGRTEARRESNRRRSRSSRDSSLSSRNALKRHSRQHASSESLERHQRRRSRSFENSSSRPLKERQRLASSRSPSYSRQDRRSSPSHSVSADRKKRRSLSSKSPGSLRDRPKHKQHSTKRHRKHRRSSSSKRTSSLGSSTSYSSSSRSYREKKRCHKKTKHKRKKEKSTALAITTWGKYGVIQECDMWVKKQEFQLWLLEVKQLQAETLPPWEEKQLFREFMEDFNTATLPHRKYYDLEKWERRNAERFEKARRQDPTSTMFDDERSRRAELQTLRNAQRDQDLKRALKGIKEDIDKVSAMRQQKLLLTQMKTLYRMGRIKEAQKIQERLRPDDTTTIPMLSDLLRSEE